MSEFKVGDLVRVTKIDQNDVGIRVGDILKVSRVDSDGDIYYFKDNGERLIYNNQVELVEPENQEATIDSNVSYVLSNLPLGKPLELEWCHTATTEQELIEEFEEQVRDGYIERGDKYMVYKLVPYKVLEIGTKETLV